MILPIKNRQHRSGDGKTLVAATASGRANDKPFSVLGFVGAVGERLDTATIDAIVAEADAGRGERPVAIVRGVVVPDLTP